MENDLQQIVVQITTSTEKRSIAQYGSELIPEHQKEIIYNDLSENEKKVFDSFVSMIKSK